MKKTCFKSPWLTVFRDGGSATNSGSLGSNSVSGDFGSIGGGTSTGGVYSVSGTSTNESYSLRGAI